MRGSNSEVMPAHADADVSLMRQFQRLNHLSPAVAFHGGDPIARTEFRDRDDDAFSARGDERSAVRRSHDANGYGNEKTERDFGAIAWRARGAAYCFHPPPSALYSCTRLWYSWPRACANVSSASKSDR